ncbi:MAG: ABC transporter permease [Bacteroidetes bacterium]|nr:ABC transporter permease [Bacteroidota bacterium]
MKTDEWDYIIEPEGKVRFYNLTELKKYKDLIFLFVKRDFVSMYKQTILGPVWVVIQPILTTLIFTIVFGRIAHIETGVPSVIFFLIGVVVWTYFADCVTKTSETFIQNQNIFGKVYFPRLAVPVSVIITNLIKFGIHLLVFFVVYLYFFADGGNAYFGPTYYLALVPFALLALAMLGMGTGILIAAMTTKYKDLRFLVQFAIQLGLYVTPVVYPLNAVDEKFQWILLINPVAGLLETFKLAFFGADFAVFSWYQFGYCMVSSFVILAIGMSVFRRVERTFMDSI